MEAMSKASQALQLTIWKKQKEAGVETAQKRIEEVGELEKTSEVAVVAVVAVVQAASL